MKKLGKKANFVEGTIEAYCTCGCECWCDSSADYATIGASPRVSNHYGPMHDPGY